MYNDLMPERSYEIRLCNSCGLRYPLVKGHSFGARCPACLGSTRILLRRLLVTEADPIHTSDFQREEAENGKQKNRGMRVAVLMDNIRSAWNVGSILRSADGFGFAHTYLCGITPTPENHEVRKTSLGAENSVPWSYHKDAVRLVNGLKGEGMKVFALEEHTRSRSISQLPHSQFSNHVVLIVGNEVSGVDPDLLDVCDESFYIPMYGEKQSFNVATAFGIAAYALSIQSLES